MVKRIWVYLFQKNFGNWRDWVGLRSDIKFQSLSINNIIKKTARIRFLSLVKIILAISALSTSILIVKCLSD